MTFDLISDATRRNWERLNADGSSKLQRRANKKKSTKMIIPLEYFSDKKNVGFVQDILHIKKACSCTNADIIYSLAVLLLKKKEILNQNHVLQVVSDFSAKFLPQLGSYCIPENEWDILGLIYQCLVLEGEKNQKGLYYSPQSIAKSLVSTFQFNDGQTFLDPCCGSGSLFLALDCSNPTDVYGIDNDIIAVFIAKINLLLKYSDQQFTPNIYLIDYLESDDLCVQNCSVLNKYFDYIATNPPWGAATNEKVTCEISSKESFSRFFVKAYHQLAQGGSIHYLFPESILNVKTHYDIRRFIFDKCDIKAITKYNKIFSGVTTKCVSFLCSKTEPNSEYFMLHEGKTLRKIYRSAIYQTDSLVFSFLSDLDVKIIEQFKKIGKNSLAPRSIWALGIVTGNNKKTLVDVCLSEYEPIFTGKDVHRYILATPNKYIKYDRTKFQQVAKDEIYFASEKLIYKFISSKLVFAYDNQKRLVLNSANILIPQVDGMSVKTVMAFLNSELFQFVYSRMFGEVKVLKGNLCVLLLPEITVKINEELNDIVTEIIAGKSELDSVIQEKIYSLYGFDSQQIDYIRRCLYGTTDR